MSNTNDLTHNPGPLVAIREKFEKCNDTYFKNYSSCHHCGGLECDSKCRINGKGSTNRRGAYDHKHNDALPSRPTGAYSYIYFLKLPVTWLLLHTPQKHCCFI